jgi:hypothetical protein
MNLKLIVIAVLGTVPFASECGFIKTKQHTHALHRSVRSFYRHMAKSNDDKKIDGTLQKELSTILPLFHARLCKGRNMCSEKLPIQDLEISQKGYLNRPWFGANTNPYIIFEGRYYLALDKNENEWNIGYCMSNLPKAHWGYYSKYNLKTRKLSPLVAGCLLHKMK